MQRKEKKAAKVLPLNLGQVLMVMSDDVGLALDAGWAAIDFNGPRVYMHRSSLRESGCLTCTWQV